MTQNKVLLVVGALLVVFGLLKPDLTTLFNVSSGTPNVSCVVDAPSDEGLLEKARAVIDIVKNSNDSTAKRDCAKLSSLYCDMAILLELDGEDLVIGDTSSIKEANSLAGKMLRLNIKDKYEGLAEAAKDVVSYSIGEDDVILDKELRTKAVQAFRALSWAFYEGSK